MIRLLTYVAAAFLAACGVQTADAPPETPGRTDNRSGYSFLTPETQALQDDDFGNPGFLWVDQGRVAFHSDAGVLQSCASCHGQDGAQLAGVAASYPSVDGATGDVVNLEGRINLCRKRHQEAAPLAYESDALLSLTAYVANLSRGTPVSVAMDTSKMRAAVARGETYFTTRRGRLNLSCEACHDWNWGRKLRGDTISQGHGNGFPAYRFEWQAMGSLHRRFRDCDTGVQAEPRAFGSEEYIALEAYLAVRGAGLEIETPAVRR